MATAIDFVYSFDMASIKLSTLQQAGVAIAIGTVFAMSFMLEDKSNPSSQARNLMPKELSSGEMIIAYFGEENGAALFKIKGKVPTSMYSLEVSPHYKVSRTPKRKIKKIRWSSTPQNRLHIHKGYQNCSCFACIQDFQICEIASDWLSKDGSLLYLNSDPLGASYLLNRDDNKIIVVWNRAL